MVEVFCWRKRKVNGDKVSIGHASMRVSIDDDTGCREVYMSWWPTGTGGEITGSPAHVIRTYREDCDEEGIPPNRIFRFNNFFDEPEIIRLWNKWRTDLQYQLLFRNCSTLVKTMMCGAGMAVKYPQFTNFCSYNIVITPEDIEFYCDQLEKYLTAAKP